MYIYIYTSVNPCMKCMVWSVTQLGLSEFCETLTGGFSSKTPMSGTLKGVELPGGWNSQGGGTPRGVELSGEWNSQGVELPGSGTLRGMEFSGGWNSQGVELSGGWNSQGVGTPREWNSPWFRVEKLAEKWNSQGSGTRSRAKFKSLGTSSSRRFIRKFLYR